MFKLVIQDDEGKTTVVPLIRDEITIGRKEGNTIRLTERNVSRRHARILRSNGEVQIEDLGSYNGIRVNNARIAERVNLRVSDQVQIGDYKLYLKAEGVEQVDDARTMPIERVDPSHPAPAPTESMPAVAPAPTQPVPIPPTPAPSAAVTAQAPAVQIVGNNPNRTLVAVADTDPDGRPRARPEHIAAAIPQQVGYGKLVVLSSNFAGKEFELSRPQMIIGRTDENDLVINHRSISRNHAKVVREPDTQRYTISDLQSSNGVRVNGQDYGKVELRRGDVIDLGHVRLRFVEPGEDFVFSRDAVITDVPETGSKKGMMIAVVLGLLVLGGVVVFFLMRDKGDDNKGIGSGTGSGTGGAVEVDAGSAIALNPPADAAEANPPPQVDAATAGNNAAEQDKIRTRCKESIAARDWTNVNACGNELQKAGGADGAGMVARAVAESKADLALIALKKAMASKNFKDANAKFNQIPEDSVYAKEAETEFTPFRKAYIDEAVADLNKLTANCKAWEARMRKAEAEGGSLIGDAIEKRANRCVREPTVGQNPPPKCNCNKDQVCENDKCVPKKDITPPPPKDICQDQNAVSVIETEASNLLSAGSYGPALTKMDPILRCRPGLLPKAYLAACKGHQFPRAKALYKSLSTPGNLAQICLNEGFDPRN